MYIPRNLTLSCSKIHKRSLEFFTNKFKKEQNILSVSVFVNLKFISACAIWMVRERCLEAAWTRFFAFLRLLFWCFPMSMFCIWIRIWRVVFLWTDKKVCVIHSFQKTWDTGSLFHSFAIRIMKKEAQRFVRMGDISMICRQIVSIKIDPSWYWDICYGFIYNRQNVRQ